MIKTIKEWLKWLSLSNPMNWEMYKERGWSYEMDYTSKPIKFYRHKKHSYFITNAFIKNPLHKTDLINRFMTDYSNKTLLMDETLYIISD
jgi:hypothetical protein